MHTPSASRRTAHVSSAPEESYLLGLQLKQEQLDLEIQPVASASALAAAVAAGVAMVIADLPLPWTGADDELSELQRTRPDVPVVFRWGAAGAWNVEDATTQLGRSVRGALALGLDREQSAEERRLVLQEVVRYQTAHLRLGRLDTWDWERALLQATEIMSETAAVERVSVWRLDGDSTLHCEALFVRSKHAHPDGGELHIDPAYRKAIEGATFVAADEAQIDPRTSAFTTDYLKPLGITAMLDAPIRCGGKVTGVVCLEHVGPSRHWNVVEQCAAATFAGVVARILEVRERRKVEAQWQESRRLEIVGRMAGAIAHDFSNLATVITGFSETLLSDCATDDPRRESLRAIHDAGASASSLVRQLLAYTRHKPTEARTIDLAQTVREMRPLVQRLLGSTIELVITAPGTPCWVRLDPDQVHRVVLNLAANSRDALPRGGTFHLTVACTDVVQLSADDNGDGIPSDVLPFVFDPLYTTKGSGGGSGLGLSAVRAIVTQAGGTVAVHSEPGCSTCFTISLPRADAPAAQAAAPVNGAVSHPAARGTVLVVDDDRTISMLVRRTLERHHYIVESESSPAAALQRAEALGDDLALVITDLTMRGMSGMQLIDALRVRRPHVPALIMTGQPDAESLPALGRDTRLLPKPFELSLLLERVAELTAARS